MILQVLLRLDGGVSLFLRAHLRVDLPAVGVDFLRVLIVVPARNAGLLNGQEEREEALQDYRKAGEVRRLIG